MNEQQGNHLDLRVRQALTTLPDVPAPGTAFDAGKLWEQLRPELAAQSLPAKPHRQHGLIGWVAAASVACLLAMWQSWPPVPGLGRAEQPLATVPNARYVQKEEAARPSVAGLAVKSSGTPGRKKRKIAGSRQVVTLTESASPVLADSATEPIATPTNVPEATSAEKALTGVGSGNQPVASRKPIAGATKRRFRVVHENELRAEEEALEGQFHTKQNAEHFVRLGAGSQLSSGAGGHAPTILVPLTRKSIQ